MTQLFTNNAISLLTSDLTSSGSTIHLIPGDGALFPQPVNPGDFFLVTLEDDTATYREIIKINDRVGDVLYIDAAGRGFEGTDIRNWPENTLVDHRITAFSLTKIDQVRGFVSDPNLVQPGQIKNGDNFETSFPDNLSCKWIVTVLDEISGKISISEILAAYRGPLNTPSFTVYAKTGDRLLYSINVVVDGANMKLNVINNDAMDLRINCIRINY